MLLTGLGDFPQGSWPLGLPFLGQLHYKLKLYKKKGANILLKFYFLNLLFLFLQCAIDGKQIKINKSTKLPLFARTGETTHYTDTVQVRSAIVDSLHYTFTVHSYTSAKYTTKHK